MADDDASFLDRNMDAPLAHHKMPNDESSWISVMEIFC